jgi:tetratricopeptide (TPR) repeat protein
MNEEITTTEGQTLTIHQAVDLAVQYHNAGDLKKAENIYQQILQVDPNQPVALHLLGVIAHQSGKNDIAIDLIEKALAIKPDYVEAYSNLSNALADLGRLDEAVAFCRKAIAIKPDYPEAHSNLGKTLQELGKSDEAVNNYKKALALKPDYAEAYNNLGRVLLTLGQLDEAIESYNNAIIIKPNFTEAHFNMGNIFFELGNLDEAITSFNEAISIKPDYAEAHFNLGNALQGLGKLDESVSIYNNAITIRPDYAEAYNNLGVSLHDLGQLDEALNSYNKAISIKADFAEAHFNLGNTFKGLGNLDEAVSCYNEAIAIKPDYAEVFYNHGFVELSVSMKNYHKSLNIKPGFQNELNKSDVVIHGLKLKTTDTPFSKPTPLEYEEFYRPGMGTENVGTLLRSLIQMVRPKRILEVGAGYTTPFLLEAIINNERVFNDGNLNQSYFSNYEYDSKLVIIDDMSLGEIAKKSRMKGIIASKYVDFVEGRFQGKAEQLLKKYGEFDFVWYDCGDSSDYEDFFSEYWKICSNYVLFHYTYYDGRPNKHMEVILNHISEETYRFDIIETHKKKQGSVTILRKS